MLSWLAPSLILETRFLYTMIVNLLANTISFSKPRHKETKTKRKIPELMEVVVMSSLYSAISSVVSQKITEANIKNPSISKKISDLISKILNPLEQGEQINLKTIDSMIRAA